MKLLELPHGHLSWSGLSTWERSEKEYVEKYILHQTQRTNSGMEFGKYVADGLERDEGDTTIEALKARLPAYETREHQVEVVYKGIPLTGRIDTYRGKDGAFREYKTGRRDALGNPPWTLAKAREHGQISFYAFMLWLKTKKVPPPAYLDWIETEVREDGTVGLAEHIHSFEVPITLEMIIKMGARIEKASRQINREYLIYKNYVIESKEANIETIRAKSKYALLASRV
jgi:hypothetical protein